MCALETMIVMKKTLVMVVVAMMTAISAQAQKIEVVGADGHGIPLVSVLTEDGNLIGTTDLNGVLADVKGAAKVAVTHVAYKPQLVTVASLQNGRITMEDVGYSPEAFDEQIRVLLMSFAYGWKSNPNEKYVMMQLKKDVHSPDRWRTNAQVNQIDKWYSLFHVTPDQKLYVAPEKRVKIW